MRSRERVSLRGFLLVVRVPGPAYLDGLTRGLDFKYDAVLNKKEKLRCILNYSILLFFPLLYTSTTKN
jgi:hypothetical protein